MTMYSIIRSEAALSAALKIAKGSYQEALITGHEALSGATLKGKAKKYGAKYAASARALLTRLQSAGLAHEEIGAHNKRILVIG